MSSTKEMLRTALAKRGMSQAQLARELNTTPSNLNQKIMRNTLTKEELEVIAAIIGAEYVSYFKFPDGFEVR